MATDSDTERRVSTTLIEDTGPDAVDAGLAGRVVAHSSPARPVYWGPTRNERRSLPRWRSADAARSAQGGAGPGGGGDRGKRSEHTPNPDEEYGVRLQPCCSANPWRCRISDQGPQYGGSQRERAASIEKLSDDAHRVGRVSPGT